MLCIGCKRDKKTIFIDGSGKIARGHDDMTVFSQPLLTRLGDPGASMSSELESDSHFVV